MNLLSRALKVAINEGVEGFSKRLNSRYHTYRLRTSRRLNLNHVSSVYGLKLKANYSDATFDFYVLGTYGFYYWDRLASVDSPFVFLDIGANQGLYTIGASQNPHSRTCYAFEPVKSTFGFLTANIKVNGAGKKCVPINKAVADKKGSASISAKAGHSGAATLAQTNDLISDAELTHQIEMVDYNDLNELVKVDDLPVVVKIDVEGFEPVVITELLKTNFAENISEIYFEVDESWIDIEGIRTELKSAGFTHFQKIGEGNHYDLLASKTH